MRAATHMVSLRKEEQPVGLAYSPPAEQSNRIENYNLETSFTSLTELSSCKVQGQAMTPSAHRGIVFAQYRHSVGTVKCLQAMPETVNTTMNDSD